MVLFYLLFGGLYGIVYFGCNCCLCVEFVVVKILYIRFCCWVGVEYGFIVGLFVFFCDVGKVGVKVDSIIVVKVMK